MNYSHIYVGRLFAVLMLVACSAAARYAMATETFSPLELERLRQVSRALLETRATERQRVLHDTADPRQMLSDIDTQLRALEAAVQQDHLPHTQVAPAPTAANNRLRGGANPAPTPRAAAATARATPALIDEALATVLSHQRALRKRTGNRGAGVLVSRASRVVSSNTREIDPAAQVAQALDLVDTELRRMRSHGADVDGLHRARQKISLAAPPMPREIAPTFQTITRHYR